MEKERLEDILTSILEYANDVSDTLAEELIEAGNMTKSELISIGYKEENHPSLFAVAEDDLEEMEER